MEHKTSDEKLHEENEKALIEEMLSQNLDPAAISFALGFIIGSTAAVKYHGGTAQEAQTTSEDLEGCRVEECLAHVKLMNEALLRRSN